MFYRIFVAFAFVALFGSAQGQDFDGNGIVDLEDYQIFIHAWGTDNAEADLDGNGIVQILFAIFISWYGKRVTQPDPQPVPEPDEIVHEGSQQYQDSGITQTESEIEETEAENVMGIHLGATSDYWIYLKVSGSCSIAPAEGWVHIKGTPAHRAITVNINRAPVDSYWPDVRGNGNRVRVNVPSGCDVSIATHP